MQEEIVPAVRGPRAELPAWVPDLLARADRPIATLAVCFALTFLGALAVSGALAFLVPDMERPSFEPDGFSTLFSLVVLAPVVETFILAAILWLLSKYLRPGGVVLGGALVAAILHSSLVPMWGPVIFWPFVIFSLLYVVWRQRSLGWALGMAMAAHALHNFFPAIVASFPDLVSLPAT